MKKSNMSAHVQEIDKAMEGLKNVEEVITLEKQADGNWIGKMKRFGKLVEIRDIDPQSVLLGLLTHPGNEKV